jgi:Zn-dependent protease with chaperone function
VSSAAPTIFTLEVNSAWVVVLAVSLVTLVATIALRRVISRPGGMTSGLLLLLPLAVPLLAATVFQQAVLPEVTVLQPAGEALVEKPDELLHFIFISPDGRTWAAYALSGGAGVWLFMLGATVSAFMLVRRFAGAVILRRLVAKSTPPTGELKERVLPNVETLSIRAGLSYQPEVLVMPPGYSGAFAVGAKRGRILVSRELADRLDNDELVAVLAHEVAHLEARDVPLVLLAGFLRDFAAWNPFAHIAYRRLLNDRELEADRRAVGLTGTPLSLASGIVKVFEHMRGRRRPAERAALALVKPRAALNRRVSNLLALADGKVDSAPEGRAIFVIAALAVALLGLEAGSRVASENSALAFVWNAPVTSKTIGWAPSRPGEAENRLTAAERRLQHQVTQSGGKLEELLKSPRLRATSVARARNVGALSNRLYGLAHRLGVPVSELQLHARPLQLLGRGTIGVYRIDQQLLGRTTPR